MILCVDIGNSSIKFGLYQDQTLVLLERCDKADFDSVFHQLCNRYAVGQIVVGSVGDFNLAEIEKSGVPLLQVHSQTPMPIKNEYASIETLGVDRLLGVVAAVDVFEAKSVLVIDAGTCITYDVCINGIYKGGAIAPGLQMRLNAMHAGTAKLPRIKFSNQVVTIGDTTESSLIMGAISGATFEMDGMINHFKNQYQDLKVILTGGDSSFFEQHIKNAIFAAPNLILDGLHTVFQHNVPTADE